MTLSILKTNHNWTQQIKANKKLLLIIVCTTGTMWKLSETTFMNNTSLLLHLCRLPVPDCLHNELHLLLLLLLYKLIMHTMVDQKVQSELQIITLDGIKPIALAE